MPDEIAPEVEVNKTCSILVMPVNGDLSEEKVSVLMYLESVCLYFSYRSDVENNFWRLFVVPFRFTTTGELYKDIARLFGIPKFYKAVC